MSARFARKLENKRNNYSVNTKDILIVYIIDALAKMYKIGKSQSRDEKKQQNVFKI